MATTYRWGDMPRPRAAWGPAEALSLLARMIKNVVKSQFQHRFSTITWFVIQSLSLVFDALAVWIVVDRFQHIRGWQASEALVIYSFFLLSYATASFFLQQAMLAMGRLVVEGGLDSYLTKPVNPLFHLVGRHFNWGYVTYTTVCISLFIYAFSSLDVSWTAAKAVYLALTILGAGLIQGSLWLISGTAAFWLMRNRGLLRLLVFDLRALISYPLTIYGTVVRVLLTFVVPLGFINFYPAHYLLDRSDVPFHPALQFFTPLVGVAMFVAAYFVWNLGLKSYQGSGS